MIGRTEIGKFLGKLFVACIIFSFAASSGPSYADELRQATRQTYGFISGKLDIGEKIGKCKFPVPSSTVRAYRLYSPGYTAAAVVNVNGKYKLKVPPGPYAVLFDIWSSSGVPVKQDALFVWVKPGEAYASSSTPKRISVAPVALTDLSGNPYSPAEGLSYDYTSFMTAFMMIDLKTKTGDIEIMEDSSTDSYAEILALIDANSAPDIPEEQRLDKNLALQHLGTPGLAYKLEAAMKTSSLPQKTEKSATVYSSLQTNLSIFEQTEESPVATDESSLNTKSAFDKAVDRRLKKLLKSLLEQINDLPLPAHITLNYQGERIFDAWDKIGWGTAKETWDVGPVILKRDPTLDRRIASKKLYYAGYSIDVAATVLSSCSWQIAGLGAVQYSGSFSEPTNADSPSVIQLLMEKVKEGAGSQSYSIGGSIFEKKTPEIHVVDLSRGIDVTQEYYPDISIRGQGQCVPYTKDTPISINATYQGQEATSTQLTTWTYQLTTP